MTKEETFSEIDVVTMLCCFSELFRHGREETFLTVWKEDDIKTGTKRKPAYYTGVDDCYKFAIKLIEDCLDSIATYYNINTDEIMRNYDPLDVGSRVCEILYNSLPQDPGTTDGAPVHD